MYFQKHGVSRFITNKINENLPAAQNDIYHNLVYAVSLFSVVGYEASLKKCLQSVQGYRQFSH